MPTPTSSRAELARLKRDCRRDVARFNRRVLGRPPFWHRQAEVARSVLEHPITLVPAGNAVGKGFCAAAIALHVWQYHPGSLVLLTASTQTQLEEVLWLEVERAYRGSRVPLGGRALKDPLKIDLGGGWEVLAYATQKTERLSGHHRGEMLAICDESSGIDEDVFSAIDSCNPSRLLLLGNPLSATGTFHDRCAAAAERRRRGEPDPLVNLIKIPSTESPHIGLDRSPVGLADRTWLQKAERDWGRGSLWWRCHVDALFPDATEETLIPPAWVDRMAAEDTLREAMRLRAEGRGGPRVLAADISLGVGRDETTVLVRDDLGLLELAASNRVDLPGASEMMAAAARRWGVRAEETCYDAGGIGRDLPGHLAPHGIEARGYFGEGPGGRQFTNLRSLCAWRLRQRLDPERPVPPPRPEPPPDWEPSAFDRYFPEPEPPKLPPRPQPPFGLTPPPRDYWPRLREDLVGLKYHLEGPKTARERKADFARRLKRSPDAGDALLMSFAINDGGPP
jgi:hypothetical protein